jgi:hypothetical protein
MSQKKLEEKKLRASELDASVLPPDLPRTKVEGEVAIAQNLVRLRWASTSQQCAKPRQKLLEREWFDEVVICPGVESGDAVVDAIARCEHEDRCPVSGFTQSAADLKAVDSRHGHVEHDGIGSVKGQRTKGARAVRGRLHVIARDRECPPDGSKHCLFVVDDEHPRSLLSHLIRSDDTILASSRCR